MRLMTLFSGIGSPEQGASRVYGDDLELVAACEWDKYARKSFKANYEIKDEHFHCDIADMDGKQYKGKVDVIFGGSPCQDYSLAGLRAGVYGKRGVLIYEYFRIIDEVQPPIFVYENVKGMKSDRNGKTLEEFMDAFRRIGYFCHWDVLNTKDYGVPQNRERIFIVGFKDPELYHRFAFAPKMKLNKRLKDVLEDDVDEKYYLNKPFSEYNQDSQGNKLIDTEKECNILIAGTHGYAQGYIFDKNRINRTIRCGGGSSMSDKHCFDLIAEPKLSQVGTLDIKGNDSIRRVDSSDGLSPTLTTMGGGNREPKILDLTNSFGEDKVREYSEYSPALRSERSGLATTQDYRIRKLTPRECFRLQDFPDSFKFVVSNTQLYKQAGNSISVNMSEMIFGQIEKAKIGSRDPNSLF